MDEALVQQIINQLTNDVNRLTQELVIVKSKLVLATNENTQLKEQLSGFSQPSTEEESDQE